MVLYIFLDHMTKLVIMRIVAILAIQDIRTIQKRHFVQTNIKLNCFFYHFFV